MIKNLVLDFSRSGQSAFKTVFNWHKISLTMKRINSYVDLFWKNKRSDWLFIVNGVQYYEIFFLILIEVVMLYKTANSTFKNHEAGQISKSTFSNHLRKNTEHDLLYRNILLMWLMVESITLFACGFVVSTLFHSKYISRQKYSKKAKDLCLMGQLVNESHSFMKYWQNR